MKRLKRKLLKIRLISSILAMTEFANVGMSAYAMKPSNTEVPAGERTEKLVVCVKSFEEMKNMSPKELLTYLEKEPTSQEFENCYKNGTKDKLRQDAENFSRLEENLKKQFFDYVIKNVSNDADFGKISTEIRTSFFSYAIDQGCDLGKLLNNLCTEKMCASYGALDLFIIKMMPIVEPRVAAIIFGRLFKGKNPVADAVTFFDMDELQKNIALYQDFNYDSEIEFGCRLIEYAALTGNLLAFKYFLMNGAEVTEQTKKYAMMSGNVEIIRLAEQNAGAYNSEMNDIYVLAGVISADREDLFDWWQNNFGGITEDDIITSCSIAKSVPFLARHLRDVPQKVLNRGLIIALMRESREILKLLLDMGADINAKGGFGETVLTSAARYFDVDVVYFLLDNGADINVADNFGGTVLLYLASQGNVEAVKSLIEKGADVNAVNCMGSTILMRLISHNAPNEVIKILLEKGANVTAMDCYFQTALSLAEKKGDEELIQILKSNLGK